VIRGGDLEIVRDELVWRPLFKLGKGWAVPLADVVAVNPDGDEPPILQIVIRTGKRRVLLISDSRLQPVWTKRAVWDEAIRSIRTAANLPAAHPSDR
jgi:hypothetical protein